ncbi:MAG: hypothetical protein GQ574_08930 [Crocinitomix sp.]|nr:hypothetical protein [Crocinitomix sp.]
MKLTLKISLLLIMALVNRIGIAQGPPSIKLNGPVKQVLEIRSELTYESPIDTTTYIFNKNGSLIKIIDAKRFSSECSFVYTYDTKGNIISRSCPDNKRSTSWINSYNDLGHLIKTQNPSDQITTLYSYNEHNQRTTIKRIDSSNLGWTIFKIDTFFQYDEKHNLTSKHVYRTLFPDEEPVLISKEINAYTDTGLIASSETVTYNIDGSKTSFSTYTYNTDGNLKSLKTLHKHSPYESITLYLYDQSRLATELITVTFMKKGKLTSFKRENHFDELGNITKHVNHTGTHIFTYTYDLNGNWIIKTTFSQGIEHIKTIRNITYFD